MKKIKLIEAINVKRNYDFDGTEAIIDHPDLGRLLIVDAYGGEGSLHGGAVRWRHGMALMQRDTDTFDSLKNESWNGDTTLYDAVLGAHDETRSLLMSASDNAMTSWGRQIQDQQ